MGQEVLDLFVDRLVVKWLTGQEYEIGLSHGLLAALEIIPDVNEILRICAS